MTEITDITRLEGLARSTNEVRLYAEFHPCRMCGCRDIGEPLFDAYSTDNRSAGHYDISCPQCAHQRRLMFFEADNFNRRNKSGRFQIAGPEPSNIISPHEFVTELLHDFEHAGVDFSLLNDRVARRAASHLLGNAGICIDELRKFLPDGTDGGDEIPLEYFRTDEARRARAEHPEHFRRAFIEEQAVRFAALDAAARADTLRRSQLPPNPNDAPSPPVVPPLSAVSIKLHAAWLADQAGGQRLRAIGTDATGKPLSALELTGAIFEGATLDRTDVSFSRFHGAHFTDVRARGASFSSAMLAGTTIVRSSFAGSAMNLVNLGDATIDDSDFSGAILERSRWYRSKVTRCTFDGSVLHDAALDRAVFTDCDFRGADFGIVREGLLGTSFEAEFVRCDLRETNWQGRSLFRAKLVDCKLAGARGTPTVPELVIERPDLSPAGDGSTVGSMRDVLVQWGIDPDQPVPAPRTAATDDGRPYRHMADLAESILVAALGRNATFDETVADLVRAGFTREQALNAVIDPASVK